MPTFFKSSRSATLFVLYFLSSAMARVFRRVLVFLLTLASLASLAIVHGAPNGVQQSRNGDGSYSSPAPLLTRLKHLIFKCSSESRASSPSLDRPSVAQPQGLYTSYADQLVTRFNISTVDEASALADACSTLFLDIWSVSANHVDIRLGTRDLAPLLGLVPASLQHAHQPLLQGVDLACAVADTYPQPRAPARPGWLERRRSSFDPLHTPESDEFFREYRHLSVLLPWMRLLQSLFPEITRIIEVGQSWEGRPLHALHLSVHPSRGHRDTVIITGGAHAREWISTSTVAFIMHSFVTGYSRDGDITTLLEQLDFIFVPTLNPDGYIYSWEQDRLWRKTRQQGPVPFCHGIDIDRSWSYEWEVDNTATSANPCSENYAGGKAFDSVEAGSFAKWIQHQTASKKLNVVAVIDLHSYSQQILMPYAFSCDSQPANAEDLEEIAQGMARAIRRTNGEYFDVISACRESVVVASPIGKASHMPPPMQASGGSPIDWFHHEIGVRYTYQIKLRDTGSYGFLLPPEYIIPTGREIFNAIVLLGQSLMSEDAPTSSSRTESSESMFESKQEDL